MSRKKSLLEELADLDNPAPRYEELDPDFGLFDADRAVLPSSNGKNKKGTPKARPPVASDSEADEDGSDSDQDDDLYDEPVTAPSSGKRAKEKGLQMRADISMEDAAYRGRRSSRQEVFRDTNDRGFIPVDSDEDDEDDSDLDQDEGDEAPEEEAIPNRRARGRRAASPGDDEDDSDLDQDEDEGGMDVELARMTGAMDEADPALEAEFDRQAQEDGTAVAAVKDSMAKDRRKGKAIVQQRSLYERSLETRILLQQCMGVANRLPRPAARRVLVQEASIRSAYEKVTNELLETVTMMADLQQTLLDRSEAVTAARDAARDAGASLEDPSTSAPSHPSSSRKRGRDAESSESGSGSAAVWTRLTEMHQSFAPFRDASIDRWQRKTLLASGRGAMKANLKALNQSVSQQVAALMREGPRAVQKTQMTLDVAPKPLALFDEEEEERKAAQHVAPGEDLPRDPETFDDAEFYQTLLKEFIESGVAGSMGGSAALRTTKRRKIVDRRASKGRKIRYQVHEKLVNFMTPVAADQTDVASQLFGNLFGRRGAGPGVVTLTAAN